MWHFDQETSAFRAVFRINAHFDLDWPDRAAHYMKICDMLPLRILYVPGEVDQIRVGNSSIRRLFGICPRVTTLRFWVIVFGEEKMQIARNVTRCWQQIKANIDADREERQGG